MKVVFSLPGGSDSIQELDVLPMKDDKILIDTAWFKASGTKTWIMPGAKKHRFKDDIPYVVVVMLHYDRGHK